jgi:haloalkane dehalogenase
MLHGNPTWSFYYRELVKALRPTHRVIVPDHMGCGYSDKPQDYDYRLETHVGNLRRLIDHLALDRYSMVVHDWGGPIGFGATVPNPERLDRLVILNTTCTLDAKYPLRIRMCKIPGFGAFIIRGLSYFAAGATYMACKQSHMANGVRAGYTRPYDSWANRIANQRFVQDIPDGPGHPTWDYGQGVMAQLAKLADKPIQIHWGMRDFCFTPAFLAAFRTRFPSADVHEYPDAGHYVLEDESAAIRDSVVAFLKA